MPKADTKPRANTKKAAKPKKDENAPKRALSAYMYMVSQPLDLLRDLTNGHPTVTRTPCRGKERESKHLLR